MVALRGGYYAWFRTWDNNLRRRRGDGYTEVREARFLLLLFLIVRSFSSFVASFLVLFLALLFPPAPGVLEAWPRSSSLVPRRHERGHARMNESSHTHKKTKKIRTINTGLRRGGRRLVRRARDGRRLREDGRRGEVEPARVRLRRVEIFLGLKRKREINFFERTQAREEGRERERERKREREKIALS